MLPEEPAISRRMTAAGRCGAPFVLGLLLLCLSYAPSRAQAPGLALIIGIDGPAAATRDQCNHAVTDLRDGLQRQNFTVETLLQPTAVALRQAIGDLAVQLAGNTAPRSLIYVCARAMADGGRLFILPSDAPDPDPHPQIDGVVIPAFLNALAGTGGSLFTDLTLSGDVGAPLASLLPQVPQGLHVMVSADRQPRIAPVLAEPATGAQWSGVADVLDHAPASRDGTILMTPAPAGAAPPAGVAGVPPTAAPAAPAPTAAAADVATAPVAKMAADDDDAVRPERPRPADHASHIADRSTPIRSISRRLMRLQDALAHLGFYHGQPSGTQDVATRTAIIAFQQHIGDAPTGTMSSVEVIRLLNES